MEKVDRIIFTKIPKDEFSNLIEIAYKTHDDILFYQLEKLLLSGGLTYSER